jgi:hypothetical protein
MKKSILSLLFLFFLLTQASAQLQLGVRGSMAFFIPAGDGSIAERISPLPGGEAGLFAGAALGRYASVRVEALYISRRWAQTDEEIAVLTLPDGTNVNSLVERTFNTTNGYISFPIITEITPIPQLGFQFGPSLNFLVRSVASGNYTGIADSVMGLTGDIDYNYLTDKAGEGAYALLNEKIDNLYRPFNVELNLGISIALIPKTIIDLRTTIGLMDIVDASYRQEYGSLLQNNYTVNAGLRYFFVGKQAARKEDKREKKKD